MSMKFGEPESKNTSIAPILDKLPISAKRKECFFDLLSKDGQPVKIPVELFDETEKFIHGTIKTIEEIAPNASDWLFLLLIVFLLEPLQNRFPEYFDREKLSRKQIEMLPNLFTQKEDNHPEVFEQCIQYILSDIQNCAEYNEVFAQAFHQKKQEIRNNSSFTERACYYVKQVLQNLPKRTCEPNEKPLTQEEVSSFLDLSEEEFRKSKTYSLRLIAELEEIPEGELFVRYLIPGTFIQRFNIFAFPAIAYGRETYKHVRNVVSMHFRRAGYKIDSAENTPQIEIPKWNSENYIHEIFLDLAEISGDISIIDKIFEDVEPAVIPYIFFNYIGNDPAFSIYSPLLKRDFYYDGSFADKKPVQSEIEYLDWALQLDAHAPYENIFRRANLFLNYLKHLSQDASAHMLAVFRELSFLKQPNDHNYNNKLWRKSKTLRDALVSIARERRIPIGDGVRIVPNRQKEADALCNDFLEVIAQGMAAYPIELFLSPENRNDHIICDKPDDIVLFKRYCTHLLFEKAEDALVAAQVWFVKFHGHPQVYLYDYDIYKFAAGEAFFYDKAFFPFITDEEFVCQFLSIPEKFNHISTNAGQCWIAYYLARWILWQNKRQYSNNVFNDASHELSHGEKIAFPAKIAEIIRSRGLHDRMEMRKTDDAELFLYYTFAALGESEAENQDTSFQFKRILEKTGVKEHLLLYFIQYRYTHEIFDSHDFLDTLSDLKYGGTPLGNDAYSLKLIQIACEEKIFTTRMVLQNLHGFLNKHTELLEPYNIKNILSYFMKMEETKHSEGFFLSSYERAIQETEPSCAELYMFLKLLASSPDMADAIFVNHQERLDNLITRCSKMLHNIKQVEEKYYECVWLASDFIKEKTANIWRALKPLIMAFRNSKEVLLNKGLALTFYSPDFYMKIPDFFASSNTDELKALRYDMANGLADYLKPLPKKDIEKKMRKADLYTKIEQEEAGFDLSYTEPSPFWRYAYVRALSDLGVKTDKRGHFFHELLIKVSEEDPSEEVKKASKKTLEELDRIRNGFVGSNHRKCLCESWWWLRQAHMLSLGAEVDEKEANVVRITEWR